MGMGTKIINGDLFVAGHLSSSELDTAYYHSILISGIKDNKNINVTLIIINYSSTKITTTTDLRYWIGSLSSIVASGYNEDIGNIIQIQTTNQTNLLVFVGTNSAAESILSTDITDLTIEDTVKQFHW